MSGRLSIVVPVFNEQENLRLLTEQLNAVLPTLELDGHEILFVNDGSRDRSAEVLDALCSENGAVRVVEFSRNFGHQAALQAGLDEARGDAVVLMDADLQDAPATLSALVSRWRDGYDVVYAIRQKRKESLLKRACYAVFYRTLRVVSNTEIPLDAGDFCLLDRRVVDALVALPERNRFLRGLRSWVGFRQTGVESERNARNAGTPKYTLRRLVGLALSGYIGFSAFPLRLASWLGFAASMGGFLLSVWAIGSKVLGHTTPLGWASTMSVMLLMGGTQLLMLGIIGEYLSRTYDEVRARPLYIVSRRVGPSDEVTSTSRTRVDGGRGQRIH